MQYDAISFSRADASEFLPTSLAETIEKEETYSYVASENGSAVGVCVYLKNREIVNNYILAYMHMTEAADNDDLKSDFLKYCENGFPEGKGITITVPNSGKGVELFDRHNFFCRNGYSPISYDGHILFYDMTIIMKSYFMKNLEKLAVYTEHVKMREQFYKKDINEFMLRAREDGYFLSANRIDPIFSRFYEEDGKILGFIHMAEVKVDTLMLFDTFIDKSADTGVVLSALLGSVLKIGGKVLSENSSVVFQIYKENEYRGIKTLFGKPREELELQELVKMI